MDTTQYYYCVCDFWLCPLKVMINNVEWEFGLLWIALVFRFCVTGPPEFCFSYFWIYSYGYTAFFCWVEFARGVIISESKWGCYSWSNYCRLHFWGRGIFLMFYPQLAFIKALKTLFALFLVVWFPDPLLAQPFSFKWTTSS